MTWNVRSLKGKEQRLINIMKEKEVDIAMLTETKKKAKGSMDLDDYALIYSGVDINERAASGVAILVSRRWKNRIHSYCWISDRIITLRTKVDRGYICFICVYAPEEGKTLATEEFYNCLQKTLDEINKNDYIVICGDLNARIGNASMDKIIGPNNEDTLNKNGRKLRDFACFNNMKIMNTFYKHKRIHKMTWAARGQISTIDYIMANDKISKLFTDVRAYRSYDIDSDHFALLGKLKLLKRWVKIKNSQTCPTQKTWKVYLLNKESVKLMYQQRLNQHNKTIEISNDVEEEWRNLKTIIEVTAYETLGSTSKRTKKKGLKIWNEEIEEAVNEKKKLYLRYLSNKSSQTKKEYTTISNHVRYLTRKAQQDSWDKYIADIENDIHGRQKTAYKIMRHLNRQEKDIADIQIIKPDEWLSYYRNLWTNKNARDNNKKEDKNENLIEDSVDQIEREELEEALSKMRNRKASGSDGIKAEMLKCATEEFKIRLLHFFNLCWNRRKIPTEWKLAVVLPIFKKGDRSICDNYRGISLLNVAYKIYSKIVTTRLRKIAETVLMEEQSGFRQGRSCTDNIFILKQILEKHREYNKETHILFVDYKKAFDTVARHTLFEILRKKGIPEHLILVIENMYNKSEICITWKPDRKAEVDQGLRQGCSLSPLLFDIYIDEALREWKSRLKFYSLDLTTSKLWTILFADDQAIIAEGEDILQKATYELQRIMAEYNLEISDTKTKVMAFQGRYPIRSKIVVNNKTVEQIQHFTFLGADISFYGEIDINKKIERFNQMNGTIRRTLGSKVRRDTLIKFYKVMSIPTCLYGSEVWTMTNKDISRLQAAEMRFLRAVAGYSLLDRQRNTQIRNELNVESLVEKVTNYRLSWQDHMLRMNNDRIPKQVANYQPRGKRNIGRPRMRWRDQN